MKQINRFEFQSSFKIIQGTDKPEDRKITFKGETISSDVKKVQNKMFEIYQWSG